MLFENGMSEQSDISTAGKDITKKRNNWNGTRKHYK